MQETRVQSLSGEDPLEEEMATHSSILDWKIPWAGEPGRLQTMWSQRLGHTSVHTWLIYTAVLASGILHSEPIIHDIYSFLDSFPLQVITRN